MSTTTPPPAAPIDNSPLIEFVVYQPPIDGLPFLSVILGPDGLVAAKRFDSFDEAEAYKNANAAFTVKAIEAGLGKR